MKNQKEYSHTYYKGKNDRKGIKTIQKNVRNTLNKNGTFAKEVG